MIARGARSPSVAVAGAKGLRVVVETLDGERLWERENGRGSTSSAYRKNGTLEAIVAALEGAIFQARGELGRDDAHAEANAAVSDTTNIQRDVPPAVRRDGNAGR